MTNEHDEVIIDGTDAEAFMAWSDLSQEQKVDLLLDAIGDLEKELIAIKYQLNNHQHLSGYSVVVKNSDKED